MKTVVIIVAGGRGKRMGRPKQFLKIAGRPMLAWTVAAFQRSRSVDGIVIVAAPGQLDLAAGLKASKLIAVVPGGPERQDSVKNGLAALPATTKIVLIHDGARPAVTPAIIDRAVRTARKYGAVVVGMPVKDTIKLATRNENRVTRTLNRDELWQAQTPQAFKTAIIIRAYARLKGKITDDAMAVEKQRVAVKMIPGADENFKVTTPADLKMMEAILR